jgi:hypothetical protein
MKAPDLGCRGFVDNSPLISCEGVGERHLFFIQRPLTVGVCAKLLTRHEKSWPGSLTRGFLFEATKVTVPTETITEGLQRIDGVAYDFKRFVDAESDLQLAALLPEQKVLMAFDLVFSPNEHAFTVVDHFDHWMIVLESLKALQGCDTITIGAENLDRLIW